MFLFTFCRHFLTTSRPLQWEVVDCLRSLGLVQYRRWVLPPTQTNGGSRILRRLRQPQQPRARRARAWKVLAASHDLASSLLLPSMARLVPGEAAAGSAKKELSRTVVVVDRASKPLPSPPLAGWLAGWQNRDNRLFSWEKQAEKKTVTRKIK